MEEAIQQFLEITKIDSKDVAEYYLSVSNGDVQMAIEMLFEDSGGESSSQTLGKSDPKACIVNDDLSPRISILEWNIQGLMPEKLQERTVAIVDIIKQHKPTVVMFQEVILETYLYFKSALKPNYEGFSPAESDTPCMGYFTAIFTDKSNFKSSVANVVPFPSSHQGRDLLVVEGVSHSYDVAVLTSHFESEKTGESERKRQLAVVYSKMTNMPPSRTVIFGGDTNLRDAEFTSVVNSRYFDTDIVNDVWNMLGSPKDMRYSWDLQKNDNQIKGGKARLRFERLYTRVESAESKRHFKPKDFRFVGTERLPCGLFPSDHWGILATFSI